MKGKKYKLDLSKPDCHVCGARMARNLIIEKERCVRVGCEIRNVEFNISHIAPAE